ncbi:MAG: type II toxin-antitoxin system death-on-curing family toxin, partial [Candidatus Cryptobacteroides sp.]
FRSSIGQIYQTWDGKDLYPSVEEKAAVLLYLVTKNHSFTDGNKRIANNALVALTLMIAESKTDEMDMMVKVVVNLINTSNR